ncbi:MAG: DUF6569 family protein [Vicinamibacterales bacterium]
MPDLIAQTLSSVTLGTPVACDAITMFPLVGPRTTEQEPSYLTLDQALACPEPGRGGLGQTEITEISAQGSVPELRVINKGAKPVLILDGEELVGAKQNRVVNLTILVAAHTTVTIPVSCVEAGRWRARSRAFAASPRTQYAAGRAKRMSQVTESMKFSGTRHSDQAEVWADIAEKSQRLGADSPTGAMEEIFIRHHDFAERCVDALRPTACQVGALFLINGTVVGFDLFDRAITLRRLLPKLVRSVAMDAVDVVDVGDVADVADVARRPGLQAGRLSPDLLTKVAEHFLERTCAADVHADHAVGMGRDLRLVAPAISGAALEAGAVLVHLSAFHVSPTGGDPEGGRAS